MKYIILILICSFLTQTHAALRDPRDVERATKVVNRQCESHPHVQPQSVYEILSIYRLNRANAILTPRPFREIVEGDGFGSQPFIHLICMQPRIAADGSKVFRAIALIDGQRRLLKTKYFANNTLDTSYGINGIEYGPVVSNDYRISDEKIYWHAPNKK